MKDKSPAEVVQATGERVRKTAGAILAAESDKAFHEIRGDRSCPALHSRGNPGATAGKHVVDGKSGQGQNAVRSMAARNTWAAGADQTWRVSTWTRQPGSGSKRCTSNPIHSHPRSCACRAAAPRLEAPSLCIALER